MLTLPANIEVCDTQLLRWTSRAKPRRQGAGKVWGTIYEGRVKTRIYMVTMHVAFGCRCHQLPGNQ